MCNCLHAAITNNIANYNISTYYIKRISRVNILINLHVLIISNKIINKKLTI